MSTIIKAVGGLVYAFQDGQQIQTFNARATTFNMTVAPDARRFDLQFPSGAAYNVDLADSVAGTLIVAGVDVSGFTIDNIIAAIGAVFFDATGGGGGGTPDISTVPHIVGKNNDGKLADSGLTDQSLIAGGPGRNLIGSYDNFTMDCNDPNVAGKQCVQRQDDTGWTVDLVYSNVEKKGFRINKINGNANDDELIGIGKDGTILGAVKNAGVDTIDLGDSIHKASAVLIDRAAKTVKIGSVGGIGNGTRLVIDDVNNEIDLLATGAITIHFLQEFATNGAAAAVLPEGALYTMPAEAGTNIVKLAIVV